MSINTDKNNFEQNNKKNSNLDKKIIGNAIVAYIFSFMFLFNKKDKYINNTFVRSHAKSALVIHFGFLLTYIIFINIWIFKIQIFSWYTLNTIISIILFLSLFSILIYWAYKAYLWKYFSLGTIIKIPEIEETEEIEKEKISIDEKNKLIIILSFIPIIGYYIFWEYNNKKIIRNTTKFNMISFIIIILLFISNNEVWWSILLLWYIVFSAYSILNLVTKDEVPSIKLNFILSPEEKFLVLKWLKKYLNAFRKKEKFIKFKEILKKEKETFNLEEVKILEVIKTKKETKLPKELIYVPIINLIFLFNKDTKYIYHIRNGITITLFMLVIWITPKISSLNIFFLFPIAYWTWYLKNRLAYKMPYIYWIYEKWILILSLFLSKAKKIKEIKETNNDIKLKVENKKDKDIKNLKKFDSENLSNENREQEKNIPENDSKNIKPENFTIENNGK